MLRAGAWVLSSTDIATPMPRAAPGPARFGGGATRAAEFSRIAVDPGVDARKVRSLVMVAEIVHGAPCRFPDPARFAFVDGGRGRQPVPGAARGP